MILYEFVYVSIPHFNKSAAIELTKCNFTDTWGSGSVWPSANTGSGSGNLWTPLDGATERGTPSSLNSFLPESLLGSELN